MSLVSSVLPQLPGFMYCEQKKSESYCPKCDMEQVFPGDIILCSTGLNKVQLVFSLQDFSVPLVC